jgi:ribosomal protein L30E
MSLIISQKLLVLAAQHPAGKPELIQALAMLSKQEIIILFNHFITGLKAKMKNMFFVMLGVKL